MNAVAGALKHRTVQSTEAKWREIPFYCERGVVSFLIEKKDLSLPVIARMNAANLCKQSKKFDEEAKVAQSRFSQR